MPTSVLLAVLAAAGLLALAPALVRRYDATERLVAERAQSTARVIQRRRRRRTVPGRQPVNPSRVRLLTVRPGAPPSDSASSASAASGRSSGARSSGSRSTVVPVSGAGSGAVRRVRSISGIPAVRSVSGAPVGAGRRAGFRLRSVPRSGLLPFAGARPGGRSRRHQPPRHTPAVYRRRRVFAALVLLNLVELVGVVVVGPGFWIGFAVTAAALIAFVGYLRNWAIAERRRRRARAREAAWLAARQAEVRREQARRAEARREAQRRLAAQREVVRRAAMGLDRPQDLPAAAGGSVSYRRAGGPRGGSSSGRSGGAPPQGGGSGGGGGGLRGRAYEAGRGYDGGRG